jgi:hypothetical protein
VLAESDEVDNTDGLSVIDRQTFFARCTGEGLATVTGGLERRLDGPASVEDDMVTVCPYWVLVSTFMNMYLAKVSRQYK